MEDDLQNPTTATNDFSDDGDSCCSTPYVSAPSSPDRAAPLPGFYYSAPTSPTHFTLSATHSAAASSPNDATASFDFEFDFSAATLPSTGNSSPDAMTSADELFFNGQIRPMKLSTHLQRPQLLAPLIEFDDDDEEEIKPISRGREMKLRAGSLRRRTRSMSPLRSTATTSFHESPPQNNVGKESDQKESDETTPCPSRSSSSRRWVFLKEFLYRSKSEGSRSNDGHKFWGSLSFSPVKDKKAPPLSGAKVKMKEQSNNGGGALNKDGGKKRAVNGKNGAGKRRGPLPSAHELHYTANRAQAEEMRRRTFLPYRQGLFGCLGFSSKSYGAINGFARALNPVSSR